LFSSIIVIIPLLENDHILAHNGSKGLNDQGFGMGKRMVVHSLDKRGRKGYDTPLVGAMTEEMGSLIY